jgi:hypothetical protein
MKRLLACVSALALVLAGAGQARADNLIVNGGFETGDFTGWNLSGNSGFISITNNPSQVHGGQFAARFGAVGSPTTLSQSQNVTTVVGHTYTLDFWLQNEFGPVNLFDAKFGGATVVQLINADPFPYAEFTVTGLVATSTTTSISFDFQQNPSFWDFDDVSLVDTTVVTPEPASLTMLAIGLVGTVGYTLRRRKQAPAAAC